MKAIDLYCGAGGTSAGAESTGECEVVFALNHWDVAVQTHSANFPHAKHVNSRVDWTSPGEAPKHSLFFASPECTHHSIARGGKPTSDQQRAGAWDLMPWIEYHRPTWLVFENVKEFRDWGPVGANGRPLKTRKGKIFEAWITAIKSMGYFVEIVELNAADFGAATSRNRLFIICRKGSRRISIPEPSHVRKMEAVLPGFERLQWRSAHEIIDWSLPAPSIFSRSKPLAEKTLARIEAGLRKFVTPYLVQFDNHSGASNRVRGVDSPAYTFVTKANQGIAIPCMIPFRSERPGQDPRTHSVDSPMPTIATANGTGLALPFLSRQFGTKNGRCDHASGIAESLRTITTVDHHALVVPFLSQYYGTGEGSAIHAPVPTIVTKDRHSLITALIDPACRSWPAPTTLALASLLETMAELGVADIGFRMLQNHELAAAQGFESKYVFKGNKTQVTRQIGNSVSPPVAAAITREILAI